MSVIAHQLLIHRSDTLLFYQQYLGMQLVEEYGDTTGWHYLLRYPGACENQASLELVYNPDSPLNIADQPSLTEGYWKITLAVPDLELARHRLLQKKADIGEIFTVPDVARLCHMRDPEGYCIELLEYDASDVTDNSGDNRLLPLGSEPRFLLSTYRVKDPEISLAFYQAQGWRLLSRQQINARGMTLYFLASFCSDSDELTPPVEDIDAIENRPWLWQRTCTLIELQHIHGTEQRDDFSYRCQPSGGFIGLKICPPEQLDRFVTLQDPDGYRLTAGYSESA